MHTGLMCSSMPERSAIESLPAQPNLVVRSLDQALLSLAAEPFQSIYASVFVIGGGQVYEEAVRHPACEGFHVTEIQAAPECDTFFPKPAEGVFQLWSKSGTVRSKEHSMVFKFYTRYCPHHLDLWHCHSAPARLLQTHPTDTHCGSSRTA